MPSWKEGQVVTDQLAMRKRDIVSLVQEIESKDTIIHDLKLSLLSPVQATTPAQRRSSRMENELIDEFEKTKAELAEYENQINKRFSRAGSSGSVRASSGSSSIESRSIRSSSSRSTQEKIRTEGDTLDTLAFIYKNSE
jgi:hypothetical protein